MAVRPGAPAITAVRPGTRAVRRVTARLAGVLVVLSAPAWVHGALDQRTTLAPWWNLLAAVLVGVPVVWLLATSWRAGDVRTPSIALAGGVGTCLLLWPLGVVDVTAAALALPWLWLILPLTLAALAVAGSVVLSLGYGIAMGGAYALIRVQPIGGGGSGVVSALEALLICALAVGPAILVVGATRAADRLDDIAETAAAASAEAERAAAAVATHRELDAVVHDTVLAALHIAVRDPSAPELRSLADGALATIATTARDRVDLARPLPLHELGRRLQVTLAAVAPDADLDVRPGPDLPADAAKALTDAALEAARNARRHGGGAGGAPGIDVVVKPTVDGLGVLITVSDDGVGFDPSLVPPQRMGLAVSVRDRMARVGGRAEVVTATGSGTTVRLLWHPAGHS